MSDIPGTCSITELIKAQLPTIQEESANGCYSQSHEIEDWQSETLLSPTTTRIEGIAATTPQHSFKIPKKTMLGKARTQKKSYHPFIVRSSTPINSMAISGCVYNHHNQSHLVHYSSGRPLTQCDSSEGCPSCVWSVGSLMAVLPDSPSPICSGYSSPRDSRNQSSDVVSFDSKRVITSTEIDKWMDNSRPHLQRPNLVKAGDHELSSQTLPPAEEESEVPEELSNVACGNSIHGASEADSLNNIEQQSLLTRLKPYHAFLDDVKRHKIDAEIEAWKKAKYLKLMSKLERKEEDINDWEFEKTKKAKEEMKKFENKLERKRAQALKKTQKKISRAKEVANKKTAKARQSTIEEMTAVTKFSDKIQASKSLLLLKLRKLCLFTFNTSGNCMTITLKTFAPTVDSSSISRIK